MCENSYVILSAYVVIIPDNISLVNSTTSSLGYGSAVLAGLNQAQGEWVCYMPSDGQIDPQVLPKLMKEFKKNKYHMVKIRRVTRESLIRFFRSKIFNLCANFIFGKLPIDINGSPRIFKKKQLNILKLEYKDSFIDLEFILKARYLNWKIKEIPILTLPRAGGKSTVSVKTIFEFLVNIAVYRFGKQFNKWKESVNLNNIYPQLK